MKPCAVDTKNILILSVILAEEFQFQHRMELVTTNHAIIESYEQIKHNGFFRLQNAASCYLNNDDTTNTKQAFHIFNIIMDFHKVKE